MEKDQPILLLVYQKTSVSDLKLFITFPDPKLNILNFRCGSGYRSGFFLTLEGDVNFRLYEDTNKIKTSILSIFQVLCD